MTTDDYAVCICKEFVKVTLALCWSLRCVPFYSWDVPSISELKVAFTDEQDLSGLALSIRRLLHRYNFHFTNPSLGFCQHIHPPTFHADGAFVACAPSSPSVYVESSAKRPRLTLPPISWNALQQDRKLFSLIQRVDFKLVFRPMGEKNIFGNLFHF